MSTISLLASPLGSYSPDQLPENPEEVPLVKSGHDLLLQAKRIHDKANGLEEEVLSCYRKALANFLPIYECIKTKKNDSFPRRWAAFFQWKADCEQMSQNEEAVLSWRRFFAIRSVFGSLSKEEKRATKYFFFSLAKRAEEKKNYPLAIERLAEGICCGEPSMELYFEKYLVHVQQLGQYVDGIYCLLEAEKCLQGQSQGISPFVFWHLGTYYAQIGVFDLAETYLDRAQKQLSEKEMQNSKDWRSWIVDMKKYISENAKNAGKTFVGDTWFLQLQAIKESEKTYLDAFYAALLCKNQKRLKMAMIYVAKTKELATTQEERTATIFLANSIRREWLLSLGIVETTSSSWFSRSRRAYCAVQTCEHAYYLAMAYLSEEMLVDAFLCAKKAKELAEEGLKNQKTIDANRLEAALNKMEQGKPIVPDDGQTKICADLIAEVQKQLKIREPQQDLERLEFSRTSNLILHPAPDLSLTTIASAAMDIVMKSLANSKSTMRS